MPCPCRYVWMSDHLSLDKEGRPFRAPVTCPTNQRPTQAPQPLGGPTSHCPCQVGPQLSAAPTHQYLVSVKEYYYLAPPSPRLFLFRSISKRSKAGKATGASRRDGGDAARGEGRGGPPGRGRPALGGAHLPERLRPRRFPGTRHRPGQLLRHLPVSSPCSSGAPGCFILCSVDEGWGSPDGSWIVSLFGGVSQRIESGGSVHA